MKQRMIEIACVILLLISQGMNASANGGCHASFEPDMVIEDCTNEIRSSRYKGTYFEAGFYIERSEAFSEKGEFGNALNDSNTALSLIPADLTAQKDADSWISKRETALGARGLAWEGKKEYEKAIADYSAVIENAGRYTQLPIVYMRRGAAWGLKGDLDQAIADASEAIKRAPNFPRAFYNRGLAWKLKGHYDQALSDYQHALWLNPADPLNDTKKPANWEQVSRHEQVDFLFQPLSFSGIVTTSPEVAQTSPNFRSPAYESHCMMETRYGKVFTTGMRTPTSSSSAIFLNSKKIFDSHGRYISLISQYAIGDQDIILFEIHCGGSSCGDYPLSFLVIDSGKNIEIIDNKDFYSISYLRPSDAIPEQAFPVPNFGLEGDRIVLNLGFEEKKRKTAVFQSRTLSIVYTAMEPVPMKMDACKYLYKYASEECIRLRSSDADCEDAGQRYSGASKATMLGIGINFHHPGFMPSAFSECCIRACQTGEAVPWDDFKKNVCSIDDETK